MVEIETQEIEGENPKIKQNMSSKIVDILDSQIKLKFKSFSSNLTDEQKQFILDNLPLDYVCNRLYFVRHGDTGVEGYQNPMDRLLSTEEERFKKVSKKLIDLGVNSDNAYILYDNWTNRVEESWKYIQDFLWLDSGRVQKSIAGLDTTDKEIKIKTYRENLILPAISAFILELINKISEVKNTNVISVIHKSNIATIEQTPETLRNPKVPFVNATTGLKHWEIREIDVNISWVAISSFFRKDLLFLNNKNIAYFLLKLRKEEDLKPIIQQFKSQELQIWELQNYINAYFRSKPKLYKKYLLSDSYELRIFCIANLIKNGEFEFFLDKLVELIDKESETNIINFIETILSICEDDENQQKRITSLLAEKQKIPVWVKFDKLELFANYEKRVKIEIRNIRKKTLDEKLQRWENVILPIWFQNDTYKNLDELIRSDDKILIEWEAGSGKSTKLLEIMEYLAPKDEKEKKDENIYFPVYLNLWIENIDNLETRINEIQWTLKTRENIKFVYLFDALDEAKWTTEEKREFINLVKKLKWTVVITSRPDNIKESKKWLKELELKPLDKEQIEQYIKNHLWEEQQKVWEQWRDKEFIKGIESNPLMLSIICNLLEEGEDIANITNIKGLYDKIVDKRLLAWEKAKKRNASLFLEERKKLLWEIAYNSLDPLQAIDKNSLDKIIQDNNNYRRAVSLEDENGDLIVDYDCLNLIFKKSDYGNYEFVHESFREYFQVQHIRGMLWKNSTLSLEQIIKEEDFYIFLYEKKIELLIKFGGEEGKQIIMNTFNTSEILQRNKFELLISMINIWAIDMVLKIFENGDYNFRNEFIFEIFCVIGIFKSDLNEEYNQENMTNLEKDIKFLEGAVDSKNYKNFGIFLNSIYHLLDDYQKKSLIIDVDLLGFEEFVDFV